MQASLKGFRESFDNDKDYIKLLDKAFYGGQLTIFDYLRELNDSWSQRQAGKNH